MAHDLFRAVGRSVGLLLQSRADMSRCCSLVARYLERSGTAEADVAASCGRVSSAGVTACLPDDFAFSSLLTRHLTNTNDLTRT